MANQAIEGQAVRHRLIDVELAMQQVSKVSYASISKVTRTGRRNPADSASAVTQIMSDVDSAAGIAHVVVTGNLPTGYYSVETYYVGNQRFVREPDGWRKYALTPGAAQFAFSGIGDMGLASSPIWSGKSFNTLEGGPRNLIVLETTISGAEIARAAVPPGVEAMAELGVDAAVVQFGIDRETSVINELRVRGSGTSGSGDQEYDYYEEIDVAVHPRTPDYRIVLPPQVSAIAGAPGVEALPLTSVGIASCWCTGCAACAVCVACVACTACISCIFPPVLVPAMAPAITTAVAAATAIATSASTAVASAIQQG